MRVAIAVLADAAVARDGMLSILGAGVNVITMATFPAQANVVLPMMLESSLEDLQEPHAITVGIRQPDGELVHFGGMEMAAQADKPHSHPDLPFLGVQVVPLNLYLLPEPGLYSVEVQLDDHEPVVVRFKAVLDSGGIATSTVA